MNRFLTLTLLISKLIWGQNYSWPTDAGRALKSNFGEFRNNHFHMGLDIKTNGKTGVEVYAVEDGYVSRMVTNFKGYGKALYINHSTGNTSVYAHLSKFNPQLEGYLHQFQNENSSYLVDHVFDQNQIKVKKGDLIGFSGNTGNSFGPHLHFELRNAKEQPLNPLINGFTIDDRLLPVLQEMAIIPLDKDSRVNGSILPIQIPFYRQKDGTYILADTINTFGSFGVALNTVDKRQGFSEIFQVRTIELMIDGKTVYKLNYDLLDYNENDWVQVVRNHYFKRLNTGTFHNLFSKDGEALSTVQPSTMTGVVNLSPGYHSLLIHVVDSNGNTATGTGVFVNHPMVEVIIQDVKKNQHDVTFTFQSKFINIPLERLTCYTFTHSGLTDQKIEPNKLWINKNDLVVTYDKNKIQNRSLQFILQNKMGAYSYPLNWHDQTLINDLNAKPDITISQTAAGVILQVETGQWGTIIPEAFLNTTKNLIPVSLVQIHPFTFISEPMDAQQFSEVNGIHITFASGTDYTFKYAFKPILIGPDLESVVLSQDENCSLKIQKNSAYEKGIVWIDEVEKSVPPPHGKILSGVYQLQPFTEPLKNDVQVGIRYDERLKNTEHLSLYYYDPGNGWTFINSSRSINRNVITGNISSFEAVCILQDNVAPVVKSTFPANGGVYYFQDVKTLSASVDDRLSGIEVDESSMSMILDGKKVLFAYQPIDKILSYELDETLQPGSHTLSIFVNDRAGNKASQTINFTVK